MIQAVADVSGSTLLDLISRAEADKRWGALVQGLVIDQQISNERAKRLLDWEPKHHGFISDVQLYYACWKEAQKKQ